MAASGVFFYFTYLTRGAFRQYALALFGVLFTICFVIIRASSLHHVDTVLGWHVGGVRMNWVLENGGILLVFLAACSAIRRLPPTHYVRFQEPGVSASSDRRRQ